MLRGDVRGDAGVPCALSLLIGVISLPREAPLLIRRCSFGQLIHYCTCAMMPFIIPCFDLQCRGFGSWGLLWLQLQVMLVRKGSSAGAQAAAVPGHEQVPQPPEEQLLTRDAQCSASLWGAGTAPLSGKASKSLSKPSPLPPLILLNYF